MCVLSFLCCCLSPLPTVTDLVPRYGFQEGSVQAWSGGDKGGGSGEDAR